MKTKIKASIHVGESLVGYHAIRYVPKNVLFKKYNGIAVAGVVALAGILANQDMYGDHILALGAGASVNEILDLVGMK